MEIDYHKSLIGEFKKLITQKTWHDEVFLQNFTEMVKLSFFNMICVHDKDKRLLQCI